MSERLCLPCPWCQKPATAFHITFEAGGMVRNEVFCSEEHFILTSEERTPGIGAMLREMKPGRD